MFSCFHTEAGEHMMRSVGSASCFLFHAEAGEYMMRSVGPASCFLCLMLKLVNTCSPGDLLFLRRLFASATSFTLIGLSHMSLSFL